MYWSAYYPAKPRRMNVPVSCLYQHSPPSVAEIQQAPTPTRKEKTVDCSQTQYLSSESSQPFWTKSQDPALRSLFDNSCKTSHYQGNFSLACTEASLCLADETWKIPHTAAAQYLPGDSEEESDINDLEEDWENRVSNLPRKHTCKCAIVNKKPSTYSTIRYTSIIQ